MPEYANLVHRLSDKKTVKSAWDFAKRGGTACLPPVPAVGSKRNVCFVVFLLFLFVGEKVSKRRKWSVYGMSCPRSLLVFGPGRGQGRFNLRRTFFRLAVNDKSLPAGKSAYMQFFAAYMRSGCIFIHLRRFFKAYKAGFCLMPVLVRLTKCQSYRLTNVTIERAGMTVRFPLPTLPTGCKSFPVPSAVR